MKPERGEVFLESFKRIEQHFRDVLKMDNGYPFRRLVEDMRGRGLITDSQSSELKAFASLRNALSHWSSDIGGAIADPRPSAVEALLELETSVTRPRRVDELMNQEVTALSIDDTIGAFLRVVKEQDFSQAPLMNNGKYVGMVTLGALARWVAANIHFDRFDLLDTSISEVWSTAMQAEDQFHECVPTVTVPEALNMFDIDKEQPARGLILVQRGARDSIRALITYEDLPLLMAHAGAVRLK